MKRLMMILALVAPMAMAAPVVSGSVSSGFVGASGSVAVCNGVADLIVVVVSAPDVPGTALFSTAEAGWGAEYSKVSRGIALAVFSKVSDGTETGLTVDNVASVDASATAFCVSGASGVALKGATNESSLANPPYRAVGSSGDRLMVAVGAWDGAAPVALPFGYGFPIDTGANLSLSFRSLVGVGDDPVPYSIGVVAKWHTATLAIY